MGTPLVTGIKTFTKEVTHSVLPFFSLLPCKDTAFVLSKEYGNKVPSSKNWSQPDTKPDDAWILDFPVSRSKRNKLPLLINYLVYGILL